MSVHGFIIVQTCSSNNTVPGRREQSPVWYYNIRMFRPNNNDKMIFKDIVNNCNCLFRGSALREMSFKRFISFNRPSASSFDTSAIITCIPVENEVFYHCIAMFLSTIHIAAHNPTSSAAQHIMYKINHLID